MIRIPKFLGLALLGFTFIATALLLALHIEQPGYAMALFLAVLALIQDERFGQYFVGLFAVASLAIGILYYRSSE